MDTNDVYIEHVYNTEGLYITRSVPAGAKRYARSHIDGRRVWNGNGPSAPAASAALWEDDGTQELEEGLVVDGDGHQVR